MTTLEHKELYSKLKLRNSRYDEDSELSYEGKINETFDEEFFDYINFVGGQVIEGYPIVQFLYPSTELCQKAKEAFDLINKFNSAETLEQKVETLNLYSEIDDFYSFIAEAELLVFQKIYQSDHISLISIDTYTLFVNTKYPGSKFNASSYQKFKDAMSNTIDFGQNPQLWQLTPVLKWVQEGIKFEDYPDLYIPIKQGLDIWILSDLTKIITDYL